MDIVYLMVPLGLVLVALGLWAFFWAVGSGQFDDLDSPGWSVLKDDAKPAAPEQGERPGAGGEQVARDGSTERQKSGDADSGDAAPDQDEDGSRGKPS